MMKHHTWMLIACLLPLVLLLALPVVGVRSGGLSTLLIVACFAVRLLMMRGHGDGIIGGKRKDDQKSRRARALWNAGRGFGPDKPCDAAAGNAPRSFAMRQSEGGYDG